MSDQAQRTEGIRRAEGSKGLMRRTLLTATLAIVALTVTGAAAQRFGKGVALTGGTSLLYVGTYAGNVQIFDEESEKQIGEIKLKTGIQSSIRLSFNKQHFYVLDSTYERVEIVDIASRTTIGQ